MTVSVTAAMTAALRIVTSDEISAKTDSAMTTVTIA